MPADELRSENPGEFTADQNGATTFASPAVKENESTRFLPQTLGGVFDESFELYKKHFLTFAMIAAVALIPTQMLLHTIVALWLRPLANQINANSSPDAGLLVLTRIGFFFTGDPRNETPGLISLLVPILISGPMAVAVSDIYIGRKATVRDAYRRARPYLPRLLGGYILVACAFLGVTMLTSFVLLIALGAMSAVLSGIGATEIGIVVAIAMILTPYLAGCALTARYFIFTTPLTVLEGTPISFLPTRNGQLVGKTRFLRTWAAAAFLPVVTYLLLVLLQGSVESALSTLTLPPVLAFLVETITGTALALFFQPFWMIFLTLLYYDYRVRREGFDLRVLSISLPTTDAPPTVSVASYPSAPPLPTGIASPPPTGQPQTYPPIYFSSTLPSSGAAPPSYPATGPGTPIAPASPSAAAGWNGTLPSLTPTTPPRFPTDPSPAAAVSSTDAESAPPYPTGPETERS